MKVQDIILGHTYVCEIKQDGEEPYRLEFTPEGLISEGLYANEDAFMGIEGPLDDDAEPNSIVFAREFLHEK